jgi:LAO/AO transport system kinase
MQLPNAGDELQAIKKGVMELADLVLINKADIDAAASTRAQAEITSSLRLLGLHGNPVADPHSAEADSVWHPRVIQVSASLGQGLQGFHDALAKFQAGQSRNGEFEARRKKQSLAWMWERIDSGLGQLFRQNPRVKSLLPQLTQEVLAGRVAASTAARNMLFALVNDQ